MIIFRVRIFIDRFRIRVTSFAIISVTVISDQIRCTLLFLGLDDVFTKAFELSVDLHNVLVKKFLKIVFKIEQVIFEMGGELPHFLQLHLVDFELDFDPQF